MTGINLQLDGSWSPLFSPKKFADYVNDHTIFKDKDGNWRLLGTCAKGKYAFYKERYFVEGMGLSITRPLNEVGKSLTEKTTAFGIKIAPTVFYDSKTFQYHLFFAAKNIFHYISDDGVNWTRVKDAVTSWWPSMRDPHVISWQGRYLMYVTDFGNKISVFSSKDLYSWKRKGTALKLEKGVPRSLNSSCESPFVFAWGKHFILLTTITPSSEGKGRRYYYNRTIAFASENPLSFGRFSSMTNDGARPIAYLDTHAPEVITDDNNNLFITTCGWKSFPKPIGVNGEGVFIRPLKITKLI